MKDITIRYKLLQGHKIHYKPGWDCHGLPVELKATVSVDISKKTPIQIRTKGEFVMTVLKIEQLMTYVESNQ